MKKIDRNNLIQDILSAGDLIKENLGTDIDPTVIDYIIIAALEKSGLKEKQIKAKWTGI
jgi:hypothetical protein